MTGMPGLTKVEVDVLKKQAETFLTLAYHYTDDDVVHARVVMMTDSMMRKMKHKWSHVAVVASEHAFFCQDLNPVVRLQYWADKQDAPVVTVVKP